MKLLEQPLRFYRVHATFEEQVGFYLVNLPDLSKGFEVYPVDGSGKRSGGLSFCAIKSPAVNTNEVFIDPVQGIVTLHRCWLDRDIAVICFPLEVKRPRNPLVSMLQEILDCPHELDHATTEALPGSPRQVLFRYTIPYAKVAEARILLAKNS